MTKAKTKKPKPYISRKQSPEERTAAATAMGQLRWKGTSRAERSAFGKWAQSLNPDPSGNSGRPRDTGQPRCPCRVMTLKRARARGREKAHKPSCKFHPDAG